jgi:aspartate-semialdehyde dehydrogenase
VEQYRVAVVGANGLVGEELVRILEERNFPISELQLFSVDSVGNRTIYALHREYNVQSINHVAEQNAFRDIDLVFFTAGDDASRHWVPKAVRSGATAIDSSSIYRLDPGVPLIIPEINAEAIQDHRGIISSPNCSAILLNIALYPLYKVVKIKKIVVSTYQSVSGLGLPAMNELIYHTQQILAGENPRPVLFPHEIGFNILPQVDVFMDNGYTKEEWQLLQETRKILKDEEILVSATCVRVPTLKGHCQAITAEFETPVDSDKAGDILAEAPGVRLMDDPTINLYPQPRIAAGTDLVLVGRVRQDAFNDNGLAMWVVADNVRKGSALNMVQIAEEINNRGWLKPKGKR